MPKPLDPAIRAQAVAAVLAGATIRDTARRFGIDPTGLSRIVRADDPAFIRPAGVDMGLSTPDENVSTVDRPLSMQKRLDFGVMLAEYLEANLYALTVQVRFFSDPGWLAQQPARDLAILHGVIADKSTRLLVALQRRDSETQSGPDAEQDTG